MTNFENIMSMSVDEFCEFLNHAQRYCEAVCVYGDKPHGLGNFYDCKDGIKAWLEQEVGNDKLREN